MLLTLVEADVATTTQLGVLQPCCFDEIGTSAQEKDYRDRAKVSPSLQVIPLRCDLKDRTAVVGRAKEMTLRIGQEPVSGSEDYPIAGATPRGHAVESAHGVDDHAALRSCPVRATSSLIASPKDQVVSSGSHPSPAAPVSDPVRVCCVRAKPCPRRLNDQGLLDSYGVYRSPWISCSSARHLVWKTQKSVAFLAVISYIFRGKRLRFSGFIRARSATFFGVWQDALLSPPLLRLRGVLD